MSCCLVQMFSYTSPLHFRELRYAAYRQFTWWLYGKLGRSHRRIIPACVVHHIRTRFPKAPHEEYEGYHSDDDDTAA